MGVLRLPSWCGLFFLPLVLAGCSGGKDGPSGPPPKVLASEVIGPGGGTVAVPGGASLAVPAGALDAPTLVSITEVEAATSTALGRYGFEPDGQVFARPVVVRLPVEPGTTNAFVWWAQPEGWYEPVGGTVDTGQVRAEVVHFSGGYAGDRTADRTVSGSRVMTLLSSNGIANVPVDLSTRTVKAYVARSGGGYDVYAGQGRTDGTFRVPGVPVGPCLLQVGNRLVYTSEDVVDLGEVQPGRRGLVKIPAISFSDPTSPPPASATFALDHLAPWGPLATTVDAIGDRIDVFSGDSSTWIFGAQTKLDPAILAGATTLSGSVDLLRTGSRIIPMNQVSASAGDHLVVAQQHVATSTTGMQYQAMTRVFEAPPVDLAPGVPLSLSGSFADVDLASSVSVSWDFGAYYATVDAEAIPTRAVYVDQFSNRFRVVGQAGGLDYGTHLLVTKPEFLILPVAPATATTVEAGVMTFGTPLAGSWGAHWVASADVHVPVLAGTTQVGFVASVRSMGAIAPGVNTVTLGGPELGLPRAPRVIPAGGSTPLDLFSRRDGVGLTPTLAWDQPDPGPADGFTVQLIRIDGSVGLPYTYAFMIDTSQTTLELPPGLLETGKEYMAVIRAYRRGVRVRAPLRIDLPLDEGVQVTAKFTP
jgi:hypothetical protein